MRLMKTVLYLFLFYTAIVAFPSRSIAQTNFIPATLVKAFSEGNAKVIGAFLNSNVELLILNDRDVYSKTQAEMIVKNFFENNPPVKFTLTYKSGSNTIRFGVGDLITTKDTFSVYFMLRQSGNKFLIHQIKI